MKRIVKMKPAFQPKTERRWNQNRIDPEAIGFRNGISAEEAETIARNLGASRRVALARAHAAQLAAIHAEAKQATAGVLALAFSKAGIN